MPHCNIHIDILSIFFCRKIALLKLSINGELKMSDIGHNSGVMQAVKTATEAGCSYLERAGEIRQIANAFDRARGVVTTLATPESIGPVAALELV
jgi:hypothetical protein